MHIAEKYLLLPSSKLQIVLCIFMFLIRLHLKMIITESHT